MEICGKKCLIDVDKWILYIINGDDIKGDEKMALPIGATPKLYPSESKRFLKKMRSASRGTATYIDTPKIQDAERHIRESGVVWKKETQS